MTIYVTRHGQTEWNIKRLVSGITDVPLTAEGRRQAERLAAEMAGTKIDIIIASDLERARETAEILAATLCAPVLQDARITERNFGEFEGKSYDDAVFDTIRAQPAVRPAGGESGMDMAGRIYTFLDEVRVKYAGQTVLLVSHGAACRVMHSYFESMTNEAFGRFATGNCQLRRYGTEPLGET